jgi:soluble lytic murein transglycosylase-like protein
MIRPYWWKLFGIVGLAATALAQGVEADIYRYVDERGVIHFSNTPSSPRFQLYMKEGRSRPLINDPLPLAISRERLQRYDPMILHAARRHGLDECLVTAVIKVESNFDPGAVSRKGAQGLMQLMPDTARDLGVRNCFDAGENLNGGVRHLRYLLDYFKGNLKHALAAYNAGRDAVLQYRGIPPYPETQQYVQMVLQYYDLYQRDGKKRAGTPGAPQAVASNAVSALAKGD